VSVDVTNTGAREGDEVPQLYIHQRIASVTQPVMQLKGFERVTLKPGEKRTVEFAITPEMLSILNVDMHRVVEPGDFDLMVGPSSDKTSTVKLTVAGTHGETGKPAPPPPPAGSEAGVVSTFDDLKVSANYGSWMAAGDGSMGGGKSSSSMEIVQPGADGTKGALQVNGEVVAGSQFAWAGLLYSPGAGPMQPANLSKKSTIRFWAKGDGNAYTLVVLTEARSGQSGELPAMTQFAAGSDWKQYSFPFSAFDTDGSDLTGLGFIDAQRPGKFQFQIDQVEIK
jgi:Fibronectin type III-like domain/Complex I intermediate-associated protein 30 (CIA30)